MAGNFGVVTFDDRGPIKNWSRLAGVAAHNNRTNPEPHCDRTAPKPIRLHGTADLIGDVKSRLLEHGIDPTKIRKNGVIAFEAILTASRAFFEAGTPEEKWKRTGVWISRACAFARRFWGENRIVCMVLHLDETTPHIHVILLPLVEKVYRRWPERGRTWALEGRSIAGPGMYQRVHDAYAAEMAPLGLVRGTSRSRAKYRPYQAELANLEEQKERAATAAEEAREHASIHTARLLEEIERQAQLRVELEARTRGIAEAEVAAARKKRELSMATLCLEVRQRQLTVAEHEAQEDRRVAAFERGEARRRLEEVKRSIQDLAITARRASAMKERLRSIPVAQRSVAAVEALRAVSEFEGAASAIRVPDRDRDELTSEALQWLARSRNAGR